MIKLSIVIPVYNVERYIVKTLLSYFEQADSSIQLIVVDDGSVDSTYDLICSTFKEYIELGVLIIIRQDNSGVSSARNTAIGYAVGEYITFLDGDDLLLKGYVVSLLNAIDQYQPDVVEFGFKQFDDERNMNQQVDAFVHQNFGLIDFNNVRDDVYAASIWYPCIRAFKRSLLIDNKFPEGVRFCEDLMLFSVLYKDVGSIYHIDKALYAYRINSEGATLNIRPDYVDNLVLFYKSLPVENVAYLDYLKINLSYLMYRCYDGESLPFNMRFEFFVLFLRYMFSRKISLRKKLILGFPNIYRNIKAVFKV